MMRRYCEPVTARHALVAVTMAGYVSKPVTFLITGYWRSTL